MSIGSESFLAHGRDSRSRAAQSLKRAEMHDNHELREIMIEDRDTITTIARD